MIRMAEGFPILLAAEILPPEIPPPGATRSGGVPDGQLLPILGAALLVVTPLVLLFVFARRRQRKRMAHRPRNPTLAETGGLPPHRSPE